MANEYYSDPQYPCEVCGKPATLHRWEDGVHHHWCNKCRPDYTGDLQGQIAELQRKVEEQTKRLDSLVAVIGRMIRGESCQT